MAVHLNKDRKPIQSDHIYDSVPFRRNFQTLTEAKSHKEAQLRTEVIVDTAPSYLKLREDSIASSLYQGPKNVSMAL